MPAIPFPLTPSEVLAFQELILAHYRQQGRQFSWRQTRDPYAILVSEFMLQQTQVERVLTKYPAFLGRFPDFPALAQAPLDAVLAAWQGLGYNRRALSLARLAQVVVDCHQGHLPPDPAQLQQLPGVGPATAGACAAFAFGQPAVFIETNIRRVFLHHFFPAREGVADREILPLVAQTLDRGNPREWYYALMDYGTALRQAAGNPNRRSAHYSRQSPFAGSKRQLRGAILRALLESGPLTLPALCRQLGQDPRRVAPVVHTLLKEGFLTAAAERFQLARNVPPRP